MIVADLIEWLEQKPPTDTVLMMTGPRQAVYIEARFLLTDTTRAGDIAAAKRVAGSTSLLQGSDRD